jgi:hypothetical protein
MRVRAKVGARRRVAVKTMMDDVSVGLSVMEFGAWSLR